MCVSICNLIDVCVCVCTCVQASDFHDGGILEFQTALGRVRMMLQVGLGTEEEDLLEKMLRYVHL